MVSFEALFIVSVAAGLLGSMTGMGGGVVLVPALTVLGLDIKHAIATSMIAVIATSSGSAAAYVRDRITNLKVGMFLEVFTILGAWAGAAITLSAGRQWLFALFGLILLASAVSMLMERRRSQQVGLPQDRLSRWLELEGSYFDTAERQQIEYTPRRAYLAGPLMFGAGLVAGLLGIGAGALKVLIFDLVMGLPSKVSTTTSDLIIGVTALAGTSVYLVGGLIDPGRVAPVILGVLAGAYVGTRLLVRSTNRTVRMLFVIVLLGLGAEMVWRGVRGGL